MCAAKATGPDVAIRRKMGGLALANRGGDRTSLKTTENPFTTCEMSWKIDNHIISSILNKNININPFYSYGNDSYPCKVE